MPLITDPIDILLDSTGDLDTSNGKDLQLSTGAAAVAQGLKIAIRLVAGECFFDLDAGLDWKGKIWGQKFNEAVIRAEFRRVILGVAGVDRIDSLAIEFNGSTRALSVSWTVTTIFGDTVSDSLDQSL